MCGYLLPVNKFSPFSLVSAMQGVIEMCLVNLLYSAIYLFSSEPMSCSTGLQSLAPLGE